MPLDPFLQPLVASMPPTPDEIADFPAFRAQEQQLGEAVYVPLMEAAPEIASRRVVGIPVDGGTIDVKVFHPFGEGPHPVHLYIHGGGWVGGSAKDKLIDIPCAERAAGADCVVVAVDYRKAPEHPFPTGLNDCYAALLWVVEHAEELGIDPDHITIGGGSAGGNLAAALALKARDENGPRIAFQLLEVPALDLTGGQPSYQRFATGYGLTLAMAEMCVRYYVPDPQEVTNPYASPLLAPDLSGLPPAHIMSAEYDPLSDDGELYAKRLTDAGVPATFSLQRGHIHVSATFTKVMAASRAWRDEVLTVLRDAHKTPAA
ncbi:alpha/beta hydrolase [Streptomyces muensis]|uniref:Alpha/beta hydrolase n=1 Tax=Streptomyces muensis TaxID=1077944 RepID=A0A9X1PXI0_STRM4|nr:alpha/beta hydrolase [Streptomyces muensis]MCF1595207.1 alpha/beta hydrolase [Streptomyces muensis]